MAILRTSRSRIATAAIVTLAVVGLGTFGAMRVNAERNIFASPVISTTP